MRRVGHGAAMSSSSSSSYPEHIVLTMPALSPTMERGTIAKWLKPEGSMVADGDILAEIETDKATVDFASVDEGYIAKVLIKDGDADIPVGQPIAVIVEEESGIAAFKDFLAQTVDASRTASTEKCDVSELNVGYEPVKKNISETKATSGEVHAVKGRSSLRVWATPLARRIARERGLSLDSIAVDGRIFAGTVRNASSNSPSTPFSLQTSSSMQETGIPSFGDRPYSDLDLQLIQKAAASRMLESKRTIPHYYLSSNIRVDSLLAAVKQLNQGVDVESSADAEITTNDLLIKASAIALRKVPELNSQWTGSSLRAFHNVDISITVETKDGLFTPIVRDADEKGLREIALETKLLIRKAKERNLLPEEFQGGTFSISNLGMMGVSEYAAIINPPQAAILAVGSPRDILVPDNSSAYGISPAREFTVTLSCDHRVVDGAVGAQWLQVFKDLLENPIRLLL